MEAITLALQAPGMLLDIGCATGGSTLRAARAAEEARQERDVWGFDQYATMRLCDRDGNLPRSAPDLYASGENCQMFLKSMEEWNASHTVQIALSLGDLTCSFEQWADTHTLPWCWVHFGTGCYLPTKAVLAWLGDRMSVGGVLYSANWSNGWAGEKTAIEEFLLTHPEYAEIEKATYQRRMSPCR